MKKLVFCINNVLLVSILSVGVILLNGCNSGGASSNLGVTSNTSMITEYSLNGIKGKIIGNNIYVPVSSATDTTSMVAKFTTIAKNVRVKSINQVSEVTANDFTNPVSYTVIRDDGVAQQVTVKLTPQYVYITNGMDNTVSIYEGGLSSSGILNLLNTQQIYSGEYPAGIAITPDSRYAYIANYGSNTVSMYSIGQQKLFPLTLKTIATGKGPWAIAVSPKGFTYVLNYTDNTVSTYLINSNGGILTSVGTVNTGESPIAMAMTSDGQYVYVVNSGDNTVSTYNAGLGVLVKQGKAIASGKGAAGITVSPDNKHVYVANSTDNTLSIYSVDGLGNLSANTPQTIATGKNPISIVETPDNKHIYVTNSNDNTVSMYGVDGLGNLSASVPQTIATGNTPLHATITSDGKYIYIANYGNCTGIYMAGGSISSYQVGANGSLSLLSGGTINMDACATSIYSQ